MCIDETWNSTLGMSALPRFRKRQWKALIDDAKEKKMRKTGEKITGTPT
jgi:hypothetical protein